MCYEILPCLCWRHEKFTGMLEVLLSLVSSWGSYRFTSSHKKLCREVSHVLCQVSSIVAFCKAVVQYYNNEIGIDKLHWSCVDFPVLSVNLSTVYLILYDFIPHVGSCIHHHSQDLVQSHHHKILCLSFSNHTYFLLIPFPNPQLSLILSPSSWFLPFQ